MLRAVTQVTACYLHRKGKSERTVSFVEVTVTLVKPYTLHSVSKGVLSNLITVTPPHVHIKNTGNIRM